MNVDCRCDKNEWYLRYWAIFLRQNFLEISGISTIFQNVFWNFQNKFSVYLAQRVSCSRCCIILFTKLKKAAKKGKLAYKICIYIFCQTKNLVCDWYGIPRSMEPVCIQYICQKLYVIYYNIIVYDKRFIINLLTYHMDHEYKSRRHFYYRKTALVPFL